MNRLQLFLVSATILSSSLCHAQLSLAWARQYNGTLNTVDWMADMVVDKAGNTYVCGTTNVNLDPTSSDIVLLKYSPNGVLLWQRSFDGEARGQDTGFGLALGVNGQVFVVGRTMTLGRSSDFVTLKYRADSGALEWAETFDGPLSSIDQAMAVATDSLGNVFVTGQVWNENGPTVDGDFCTLKYGPQGNLLWSKVYDGPNNTIGFSDQAQSIVVDSVGDVVVNGESPDLSSISRIATIKYRSSDGAQLWLSRSESFSLSGTPISLQVASNNDIVIGGNSQDFGLQVTLTRLNGQTGVHQWTTRESFPHGGRLRNKACLAIDPSDNLAISVTYDPDTDNSNLNYNIQTTKYRFADGGRIWSVSYGNTNNLDGQSADAVTSDTAGNVYVAGSDLFAPNNVVSLWKYDATDGHLLWKGTYNGPKQPDVTTRIRLDQHGDIIAAGITGVDVGTGNSDIQVVKFSRKVPRLASRRT